MGLAMSGLDHQKPQDSLSISQKFDLLASIFQGKSIRSTLDKFSSHELVQAHSFLWDKLVEIHYRTRNTDFQRDAVTRDMVPSATYQRQQGCDLRLDYCKGVECIWSNPVCAGSKVKNNMEIMAKKIVAYVESGPESQNGRSNKEEVRNGSGKWGSETAVEKNDIIY